MPTPSEMRPRHETCYYCKLTDHRVEAGGIWYCPNVLCKGCGAQYWRSQNLKSYSETASHYTFDVEELVAKAREYVNTLPYGEKALIEKTLEMIPYWLPEMAQHATA